MEFLSSLWEDTSDREKPMLRFRLNNRPKYMSLGALARLFGLPMGGDIRVPQTSDSADFWRKITSLVNVNSFHLNIVFVQHPCFMIF